LVDPEERTVEVFESLDDGSPVGLGQTLRSPHLPGFELSLAALFAAMDQ
jgi:Uma2 family endonuclease